MTNHDPAQTETLMGVTVSKRDLTRIPRQTLGAKRCVLCDWPLNPDGECPRCYDPDGDSEEDDDDEGLGEYEGLTPAQIVMRLQDKAADDGDLALNDALRLVLDALASKLPAQQPTPEELREKLAVTLHEGFTATAEYEQGADLIIQSHIAPLLARVSGQATRLTALELAAATLCQAAGNYADHAYDHYRRQELAEQIEAMRRLLGETP